jgi:phosphoribosyl 1,2-cyclic phosphodiesterase
MSLQLKLWGVRGSLPAPHDPDTLHERIESLFHEFLATQPKNCTDIEKFKKALPPYKLGGYGGNTLCAEVRSGNTRIIIDGGSGIRRLALELLGGPCGQGKGESHILFTHFHWDHLIGLPFFTPIFIPGNVIHVYAVQPDLEEAFRSLFRKPYFPVPFDSLGARVEFHTLEPRKPAKLGDIQFTPYQLDHPDPCWGFKFEHEKSVYSHCVDTEGLRVSSRDLGPDLPLYQNVDLMFFDAQYTLLEATEKINWGHSAATIGLDIAMREGIKKVLFAHHDPAASDEKIAAAEREARDYYENNLKASRQLRKNFHEVHWEFAREGMLVTV